MQRQQIDLRHLLGILSLVDPDGFRDLSAQLGCEQLRLGGVLGESRGMEDDPKALTPLESCIVATTALKRLRRVAEPALSKVSGQLKVANRTGLVGDLVAAFAAAGVVAAIWGAPPKESVAHSTAVGMAILSFLGGGLSLASRYLRRDIGGTDGGLASVHRKLSDSVWEADTLSAKLDLVVEKGQSVAGGRDASALIERAEKLASELFRSVTDLGIPVGA